MSDDEQPVNPQRRIRCPWCRKSRPVNLDGRFRKHPRWMDTDWDQGPGPCKGSNRKPEEFE